MHIFKSKDISGYNKKANEVLKNTIKIIEAIVDKCKNKKYENETIEPTSIAGEVDAKHFEFDEGIHVYIAKKKSNEYIYILDKLYKDIELNTGIVCYVDDKGYYFISIGMVDENRVTRFAASINGCKDGEHFYCNNRDDKESLIDSEDNDIFDIARSWIDFCGEAQEFKDQSKRMLIVFKKKIEKVIARDETEVPEVAEQSKVIDEPR